MSLCTCARWRNACSHFRAWDHSGMTLHTSLLLRIDKLLTHVSSLHENHHDTDLHSWRKTFRSHAFTHSTTHLHTCFHLSTYMFHFHFCCCSTIPLHRNSYVYCHRPWYLQPIILLLAPLHCRAVLPIHVWSYFSNSQHICYHCRTAWYLHHFYSLLPIHLRTHLHCDSDTYLFPASLPFESILHIFLRQGTNSSPIHDTNLHATCPSTRIHLHSRTSQSLLSLPPHLVLLHKLTRLRLLFAGCRLCSACLSSNRRVLLKSRIICCRSIINALFGFILFYYILV